MGAHDPAWAKGTVADIQASGLPWSPVAWPMMHLSEPEKQAQFHWECVMNTSRIPHGTFKCDLESLSQCQGLDVAQRFDWLVRYLLEIAKLQVHRRDRRPGQYSTLGAWGELGFQDLRTVNGQPVDWSAIARLNQAKYVNNDATLEQPPADPQKWREWLDKWYQVNPSRQVTVNPLTGFRYDEDEYLVQFSADANRLAKPLLGPSCPMTACSVIQCSDEAFAGWFEV